LERGRAQSGQRATVVPGETPRVGEAERIADDARWLEAMIAQLPPHVDAEFAGSRRVALGEQNVVEAFMMLAYTDIRTAWPPLDCVPVHNISLRDIGSTFGRFWSAGTANLAYPENLQVCRAKVLASTTWWPRQPPRQGWSLDQRDLNHVIQVCALSHDGEDKWGKYIMVMLSTILTFCLPGCVCISTRERDTKCIKRCTITASLPCRAAHGVPRATAHVEAN